MWFKLFWISKFLEYKKRVLPFALSEGSKSRSRMGANVNCRNRSFGFDFGLRPLLTTNGLWLISLINISFNALSLPDIIESITIQKNELRIIPHHIVRDAYFSKPEFLVSYDQSINLEKLDFSVVTAPFVLCLIPVIWISNQKFSIHSMDRQLYFSLQKIHEIFKLFYPSLSWSGELIPEVLVDNCIKKTNKNSAAILFSHGVDAVCSSLLNVDIKQLLITISGCDVSLSNDAMWNSLQKRCHVYAQSYGFETSFVKFNYRKILNQNKLNSLTPEITAWWCDTLGSLTHIGLSLPIAYLKNYPIILMGASFTPDFPFPHGNHPAIDNNIMCAGISARTESANFNRVEKIKYCADTALQYNRAKPFLRVCWRKSKNAGNCCTCEKCLRTINAIIAIGCAPQEFGFLSSLEEIKNNTDDLLRRKIFTPDFVYEWNSIKNEMRKHYDQFQEPYTSYADWFLASPLRASKKNKFARCDKEFFIRLWQESFCQ